MTDRPREGALRDIVPGRSWMCFGARRAREPCRDRARASVLAGEIVSQRAALDVHRLEPHDFARTLFVQCNTTLPRILGSNFVHAAFAASA